MNSVNLRPALASHLQQRVTAFEDGFRHNLAIIAPPGSGKTFQLQQLLLRPRAATMLMYCPLYQESCRSFVKRFLAAILQAGLASPASTPHEATLAVTNQLLEGLLRAAEPRLPRTVAAMRPIEALVARRCFSDAFNRTLDTIPMLIEERQQSCVVILDEFLFLEELGFVHAFHELGKRVMTWPKVLFILSSSSPFRARNILRERLHLLFGQFELLTLTAVDAHTASGWMRQGLKGLRGTDWLSPFLMQWLGAYPRYLTVFLKRLKELATLRKTREFTESLFLHTAWDLLGSPEGTLHQWCVSRTAAVAHGRLGARALDALIQVAQGARTMTEIGRRIGRGGLSEALQVLVEEDLAQRNGTCWMVTDPVLRCWLSTVFSAQRLEAQPNDTDVRQSFDTHLRELWNRWIQAYQLSFSKRVEALFAKFSDETVSLDSKTGRLPKFQTLHIQPTNTSNEGVYLVADGPGRRWCAAIQEHPVDENVVAGFEAFCRLQTPKPARKILVTKAGLDHHVKVLAKTSSMWVWEAEELQTLLKLYEHL